MYVRKTFFVYINSVTNYVCTCVVSRCLLMMSLCLYSLGVMCVSVCVSIYVSMICLDDVSR